MQVNRELMNVIETLQTQMEEESLKAKEAEDGVDGQSLNSSENASDSSDMEMEEDDDSADEESDIDADETEENCDVDAENKVICDVNAEIPKANKNDEPSNGTKAGRVSNRKKPCSDDAKASDSTHMDNQSDIVAENKENCDVNAEVLKVDKNDKPSNDTKGQRVSKRKKPCNGAGDGGSEDSGTVKVGRPKRACVGKKAGAN